MVGPVTADSTAPASVKVNVHVFPTVWPYLTGNVRMRPLGDAVVSVPAVAPEAVRDALAMVTVEPAVDTCTTWGDQGVRYEAWSHTHTTNRRKHTHRHTRTETHIHTHVRGAKTATHAQTQATGR